MTKRIVIMRLGERALALLSRGCLILMFVLYLSFNSVVFAKTKITVWAMGYEGQLISKMADRFEKNHPEIEVVVQAIPWGSAHEKLLTSIMGNVPPDISQMGTTWIPEFQAMGAFASLDKFLAKSKIVKEENFFKSSFDIGRINGEVYGIPWYVDTRVLFYRKDILKRHGFKAPDNWDELLEICNAVSSDTNNDGKVDHYGIALALKDWQMFLPFLWQNGGEIFDENRKIRVKEQEFNETVNYYKKFFESSAAPIEAPGFDLVWAFKKGIYAMFISGPWMVNQIRENAPEIEGKWGVTVLPKRKTRTSFIGGSHLAIFKGSKNKEEAWKFIEFMSKPENQIEWFKISHGLPSTIKAWQSSFFDNKPMIKVFGRQLRDTKSPPNIPHWEEIAASLQQRLEEVFFGRVTVEKMQGLLYKDISNILEDKYKKRSPLWLLVIISALIASIAGYLIKKKPEKKIGTDAKGLPVRKFKNISIPYIFILPCLLPLLIFLFFPIVISFLISFTDWNVFSFSDLKGISFIGFSNYLALFKERVFRQALLNTVIFSFVGIPLNIGIALFFAVLIDKEFIKSKAFFRGGYFIPVITTLVAAAIVWRWLYDPEYGLFNYFLGLIKIPKQTWLSNPNLALISLVFMSVWKNFGYNMIIFLAGLQAIPKTLYDSAKVDGADSWQIFRFITLPCLFPTMVFVTITTTIGSFQFFAEPYIMTKGGPLNRTISMVMYMYNQGFKFFKLGYGSAIAYSLFLLILMFTIVQIILKKKFGYET